MCIALFHSCIHLNCTLGQLFFQEATEETLMDDLTRGTGNQRPAPVGTLSLLKEWTWGWMGGGVWVVLVMKRKKQEEGFADRIVQ